jgi:hypothetical protein
MTPTGVLLNLQLSPASIVCLVYPLVNTEDFPEGISMNSSGVVGLDLFNDPRNRGPAINGVKTYSLQVRQILLTSHREAYKVEIC